MLIFAFYLTRPAVVVVTGEREAGFICIFNHISICCAWIVFNVSLTALLSCGTLLKDLGCEKGRNSSLLRDNRHLIQHQRHPPLPLRRDKSCWPSWVRVETTRSVHGVHVHMLFLYKGYMFTLSHYTGYIFAPLQ